MSAKHRQLLACAMLLTLASGLLLFLNQAKLASTFEARASDRGTIIAHALAESLEARLALGLPLANDEGLRAMLQRARDSAPGLRALAVLDPTAQPLAAVGDGDPQRWQSALSERHRRPDRGMVVMPLAHAFDAQAGWLLVELSLAEAGERAASASSDLQWAAASALAGSLIVLAVAGARLRAGRQVAVLVTALLMMIQATLAWNVYRSFQQIAQEDASMLGMAVAATLTPTIERALSFGIPLDRLEGMEAWLAGALHSRPELASLSLVDSQGRVLFEAQPDAAMGRALRAGDLVVHAAPIGPATQAAGALQVGLDLRALAERSHLLAIEFLTLLLIGWLLSREILGTLGPSTVSDRAAADLARLRLPLLLYFIGSELPRAFLPVWSTDLTAQPVPAWLALGPLARLSEAIAGLSPTVLAAVPVSAFLLSVAAASAWAGQACARHGPRRVLAAGLVLAALGHLLALVADSLLVLLLARIVAGVSFACASLAALDYIGRSQGAKAGGMALYLAVYVTAGICGSGLGALLVDRAGIDAVFMLGLGCSALGLALLGGLPEAAGQSRKAAIPLVGSLFALLRQPAFTGLLAVVALPMQIVQQGLLFYWTPLALASLDQPTSTTGLAMMAYFLMVLGCNRAAAGFADRTGSHRRLVTLSLAISGACAVQAGFGLAPAAIVVTAVAIGVAWALGFPSLGALSLQVSQRELAGVEPAVTLGLYRSIERIGAMLAPPVTGLLIALAGYARAASILGTILLGCALAWWLLSRKRSS